jgi:type IV secretion system protein VirD4
MSIRAGSRIWLRLAAFPILLALAAQLGDVAGYAADDSFLREMPSAARVLKDMRGNNPLDTAARATASFTLLTRMMFVRAGRTDMRMNAAGLTPQEAQIFQSYAAAVKSVVDPLRATFDRNCKGENCDNAKLDLVTSVYDGSPAFQRQLDGYFSPQWLADYQRAKTGLQASVNPRPQPQGPNVPANDNSPGLSVGDIAWGLALLVFRVLDNYGFYIFVGAAVLFWVRARIARIGSAAAWKRKLEELRRLAEANKLIPGRQAREKSDAEMTRFGGTKEARAARIEDLFNRRSDSLTIELSEWDTAGNVVLQGSISRALGTMAPRERETLRAAYHLYNLEQMDAMSFHIARLALVFGDGKAQVYNPVFAQNMATRDFATAFKNYTNMTEESAVSHVFNWLQPAVDRLPNDPILQMLKERLLGGGTVTLRSTTDFVAAQGKSNRPALILGIAEDTGQIVTYSSEGSVITIAPPGSGKTQCHVFPTLLSWNGPAVVLDVKGEIYAATSNWRKENVGPVYKFAPLEPATSNSWNPLSAVRSDPQYLWEDARFLADMMLVPTGAKDPFWENRARDVLTAAIARTCLTDDPTARSMANIIDIFNGVGWDMFIRGLQARVDIRSMTRAGSSLADIEPKTRDGVLQTGLASLSAWDGDRIDRATRKSDWSPLDLRSGTNPTIYICLKPNEVESYISMLRVFIAQHIRMLTSSLPPRDALPILFVLDELPRLRQMPPVEEALEIGRQYGIRLWMFAQSLGQLENAYPNAEGMVGNCAVRMFMNPSLHDGTAQKLSDEIGMQESVLDNSRQKIVEAPVLAGPEYKDFLIVMASGFKPFRLRKSFAWQDKTMSARMGGSERLALGFGTGGR